MKRILTMAALAVSLSGLRAQTQTEAYIPGVTPEGAVYFLPKTAIRVAVLIETTTYTPGDFAQYADRYLRLKDVGTEPYTAHRIIGVSQTAVGVRDTSKVYAVKFNNRTSAVNVNLSNDGVLLAVNTQPVPQVIPEAFKPADKPAAVNPRQYMTEEILAAGSAAKMAQLTAAEIYDLRDNRTMLIQGQADFMPKDAGQMKMMLSQLEQQDQALTSLFTGVVVRDTVEEVFMVRTETPLQRHPLFRFSKHFGLVDADDLSGTPYYISVENLTQLPAAELDLRKKKKAESGLFYNVPGKMLSTIHDGNNVASREELPAAQFGHVELLSGELFNKHYGTRVRLNPITGGIDKLEAEQPK